MTKVRTTVLVPENLMGHIQTVTKGEGITLTNFIISALLNECEKYGDFSARDEIEEGENKWQLRV